MAKKVRPERKVKRRARAGVLTVVLLCLLLACVGWELSDLQEQVSAAQAERDRLATQVEAQRQENDALTADIAEGATDEKIEEIARNELGLVFPGDYLFPDGSKCPAFRAFTGLIFPPGCETARTLFEKDGRFRPFPQSGESGGFQIRSGSVRAKILGRRNMQLYGAAGREHY